MSIPGENLLSVALTVISSQEVLYYQFIGRTLNVQGVYVSNFANPAIEVWEGSVQPVNRSVYAERGLEFEKNYVTWFLPYIDAIDLVRDESGDQFEFNGKRYQLKGKTDWFSQDGWNELLAIEIGPATGSFTNA
jgi:hypothetical protein